MNTQKILLAHDNEALGNLISDIFSQEKVGVELKVVSQNEFLEMDEQEFQNYQMLIIRGSFLRYELPKDFCDSLNVPVVMISGGRAEYEEIAEKRGCLGFIPAGADFQGFKESLFKTLLASDLIKRIKEVLSL